MARMVDLIREGSAPESILRRAARGGLSLPINEAIELLVLLSAHRELGKEAEHTLESWDEASLATVASDPGSAAEVLVHLLHHQARRPALLLALCENPTLPLAELEALASRAGEQVIHVLMQSPRVCSSARLLGLMVENPSAEPLREELLDRIEGAEGQREADAVAANLLALHAADVAREDAQPFELVSGPEGEDDALAKLITLAKQSEASAVTSEDTKHLSLLQRIGRLRVGERIKLAVRGNREERMVLIRDRSKLVALSVLESPKVNDAEMESFAAMKNVQESVLRAISQKRNYMKNYGVVRTLANNPKTPIDVTLPLLQHLMLKDQRALAVNKNVNETVRKVALRLWRMKSERKKD